MNNNTGISPVAIGGGCLAAAAVFTGIVFGTGYAMSWESTGPNQIAIIRNGGPMSGKDIKTVLQPNQGAKYVGYWTTSRTYSVAKASYTITDDPKEGDTPGVDVVSVPSSDGVQMGIQGTMYYTLNGDPKTIKDFDDKFGSVVYSYGGKTGHVYDGSDGFGIFMNQRVRPVINNALRIEVSGNRCADLISSCALVQNNGQQANPGSIPPSNTNLNKIEGNINDILTKDIKTTLGDDYITGITFVINKVDLPPNVQAAVNDAQAAYAQVSQAQAKVALAQADARANEARQQGYNACPVCGQIDLMNALPKGVTVYAPGTGTPLAISPK
jgi:hypothetical protein